MPRRHELSYTTDLMKTPSALIDIFWWKRRTIYHYNTSGLWSWSFSHLLSTV